MDVSLTPKVENSMNKNQIKNRLLNKQRAVIACALATIVFTVPGSASESKKHHSVKHGSNQTNFGPGDHYQHRMSVNPSDYKKITDISHSATDLPKPLLRKRAEKITIKLNTSEVIAEIAPGISYHYWTFNNTVPGPFLRVRQGDTVELSLHNEKNSSHAHAIDLHAVTGPGGGLGVTKVEPGQTKTLLFKATTPGLYVYHCAHGNPATHIANGMYGLILVEPPQGLAKVDKEFYVMQGELYTHGRIGKKGFQAFDSQKMIDERPEYIVFNGRTGALVGDGQLNAKVGDKVRLFIGNAGVAKISSFHIIGEIFDRIYPEASLSSAINNVQTTIIPAGGASVVEFQVDYPGNYVLVDHALTRIDRGAWGILNVTGKKNNALYSGDVSPHTEHGDEH